MTLALTTKQSHPFFEPGKSIDEQELSYIDTRIRQVNGLELPQPVSYTAGVLSPVRTHNPLIRTSKLWFKYVEDRIKIITAARQEVPPAKHANIIAIVPTYETEADIHLTIESLLRQTRPIDLIVIAINGPNHSHVAMERALPYAAAFRNVIVERPENLAGKVNTLNWAYMRYVHYGSFDFVLGVDADVEADSDMVKHLETDLISRKTAGGVMARYSFKVPEDMKGKSRSLVYGQRHEFTMTGIKHQLTKDTSEILGGQATLFRATALKEAVALTEGPQPGPWDVQSKVEDAQLTRTLQSLNYTAATSRKARAWTGLMYTASTWQKQRRKWQDGHLGDMLRDFHPWLDRRRWFDQVILGWNLMTRVLFATLLITSITLDKFLFVPLWLIPIGLAILQSLLVAIKIPQRQFGELMRSLLFIPGELYYMRTLSVWLDSVMIAILNITRDGWKNQALAEQSKKKTAHSAWLIIILAVLLPTIALQLTSKVVPAVWMDQLLNGMWIILTVMTVLSVLGMIVMIIRIVRNYRTLTP